MSAPQKVHYAQRYSVTSAREYEYVGGVGNFDVFWFPVSQDLLVKGSNAVGENFKASSLSGKRWTVWTKGYNNSALLQPTPEETEAMRAMVMCFAQANRPEEWDATTETSAPCDREIT
jgi:hypothetical protein